MVWPQNPTLPRLRRPGFAGIAPRRAPMATSGSGSPRPAPARPVPRAGASGRGKLNRNNIISRKSAQICTNAPGV